MKFISFSCSLASFLRLFYRLDSLYLQSDYDTSEHNQCDEDNTEACDRATRASGALAYKRLIAIHNGKLKGCLKEELNLQLEKVRRISLSEQKFEKAAVSYGTDVVR